MTQRLTYNLSGQTLRHTPLSRQASAAWVLEDMMLSAGASGRTLQSGTALVDTATEPTIAAAGPAQADPTLIDVTDIAGFVVGHTYQIVHPVTGATEIFRLAEPGDEAPVGALYASHALCLDYPSGSTVRGVELVTAVIADAHVQDLSRMQNDEPLRIVWTYANNEHHQELVRLVRHDYGDVDLARARLDIFDVFPDAATRFAYYGKDTLGPHLRVVYRQLRTKLLDRKIHAEEWLTGDQGHFALVWRTLWHFAQLGNTPSGGAGVDAREWLNYCRDQFEMYWGALTSGEGGAEVALVEPTTDTTSSTQDVTYRRVFGEL